MKDINRDAATYNSIEGGDRRTTVIAGAISVVLTTVLGVAFVMGTANASVSESKDDEKPGWVWDRQPERFDYGWRMPR